MNRDLNFNNVCKDSEDLLKVLFGSVIFKSNKSDTGCDLPDNEGTVDLIKYLDSPDTDDEMPSVVSSHNDSTPSRPPSPYICPPPCWSLDENDYSKHRCFKSGFKNSSVETDEPCKCCPHDVPFSRHGFPLPSSSIFKPVDPHLVYPNPRYRYKSQVPSSVKISSEETSNDSKSQFHTTIDPHSPDDFLQPSSSLSNHCEDVKPSIVYPDTWNNSWTPSSVENSSEETVPGTKVLSGCIKKEEPDSDIATGDNSDVDVETIPEAPKSADLWESNIQYSSLAASSLSSPEVVNECKSSAHVATTSKPVSGPRRGRQLSAVRVQKASVSQSTSRASSSTSQFDNLEAKQCATLGRKLAKDKKLTKAAQAQPAYTHVLCSSNSVNFHDYAMSPMACTSASATETIQPAVQATRIYRRNTTVEAIDKEKQNHHNQLERNRRQKLADLFTDLRDQVPTLTGNAKASKVHILKEAAVHIHYLQRKSKSQEDDIYRENRKQQLLRSQLRQLQAQICSRVK